MKEADLRGHIAALCKLRGWKIYWTHRSDRSPSGFPDLVMAHPAGRLLMVELKRSTLHGRSRVEPTEEQQKWLDTLAAIAEHTAGVLEVHVWRPEDWLNGTIRTQLERTSVAA